MPRAPRAAAASTSRSAACRSSRTSTSSSRPGEVVGLLGDNGAGKSTLIKIITGVHQPDQGEILFGGQPVDRTSTVQKARALGVETVFQERALAEQLPLWRNIFMGRTDQRVASGSCEVGRDAPRSLGADGRVDGLHVGGR